MVISLVKENHSCTATSKLTYSIDNLGLRSNANIEIFQAQSAETDRAEKQLVLFSTFTRQMKRSEITL